MEVPPLGDSLVKLQPVDRGNVDLLVAWTLDPIAQGQYKRVPSLKAEQLRDIFLFERERQYFVIRRAADAKPLGRFYWRAWRFGGVSSGIDWELNIFVADPIERGKGYGASTQRVAAEYLAPRPETRSVFAFTLSENEAERRALLRAGFREKGPMPNPRYPVGLPTEPCVLFVWQNLQWAAQHAAAADEPRGRTE